MPHLRIHMPHFLPNNTAREVSPAEPQHHWPQTIAGAVGHIPHHLPPPRPHPWRQDAIHTYFEMTRMAREMGHL
jgi:hypothetical protein